MSARIKTIDSSLTLEDRIATLTFERDDLRNALTGTALVDDIVNTVEWANTNSDVSVLILTGSGKSFSAGGNIKEMQDKTGMFGGSVDDIQQQYRQNIQRIPLAIHKAEIPLIAAVNGAAIGAGMDLSCMCDFRIGSTHALFGETFINLGIIPGDGGAWFLQRLIGYQKAAELTFTGRLVEAQEAQALGLLLDVVEADKLLERTLELARSIASKPPLTIRHTKRLLKQAQQQALPEFLDNCANVQAMCHHTEDHHEAVDAFLAKRKPLFKGR